MVYKKKFNPFSGKLDYVIDNSDLTSEPTGFIYNDSSNCDISYDSTTRKVTLTGSFEAYWKGVKISVLTSGWVSDAHDDTNGPWFLYYDGTNFVWSSTTWTFEKLMIAYVYYGATNKFGIREPHGLMQNVVHKELHNTIGTFLTSGGDLSGYTLSSTTASERRPDVSAAIINDEDIETTNPTLTSELYTIHYLTSTGTSNFTIDAADIVPLSGSQPYYNQYTGGSWTQTLLPVSAYMNVWLVALPMTSDTTSQKYRYLWMQGQQQSLTLSTIQSITPASLNLGQLTNLSPEFVFIGRIIIRYVGGNWQLIQVDKLTGSRVSQVITTGAYLSSVNVDNTLNGSGTVTNPLSQFTYVSTSTTPYTASATDCEFIDVDASGGNKTVNLPTAVGNSGLIKDIRKSDSSTNTVTVETNSTETINGSDGIIISNQYDNYTIISDGTNWVVR